MLITTSSVLFDPVWPPGVLIATGLLIAILAWFGVRPGARHMRTISISSARVVLLVVLRIVAIAGVITILFNPQRRFGVEREEQENRRPLFLLVDDSASMCTEDIGALGQRGFISRYEAIQDNWLSNEFLNELSSRAAPRLYRIGNGIEPVKRRDPLDHPAAARESRLTSSINSLARGLGGSHAIGIVLLSDGRDTSDQTLPDAIPTLTSLNVPLFAVPVGSASASPDVSIRLSPDQSFIYRGQHTTLRAEIEQVGYKGEVVELTLSADGIPIEHRRVMLTDTVNRLSFDVAPDPHDQSGGSTGPAVVEYQMAVESLPGERISENNRRMAFVQVDDEFLRVAIFENEPYWDSRFLIRALRQDPQIELTTFIGINDRIEHHARYAAGSESRARPSSADAGDPVLDFGSGSAVDIPIPTTSEQLSEYDVVILGRGADRWFGGDGAAILRDYVLERGGSLVFCRGEPFSSATASGRVAMQLIDPISPVEWGRERLRAGGSLRRTPAVRAGDPLDFGMIGDSDQILTRLPGMVARTEIQREKAVSSIWLRSGAGTDDAVAELDRTGHVERAMPVAVAHLRAGRGQVLAVLTHGLWQWALLPAAEKDVEPVFDLFWTRAMRWLAGQTELLPGQSVKLSIDRFIHEPGDEVQVFVQTRFTEAGTDTLSLRVRAPDGRDSTLDLQAVPGRRGLFRAGYRPESGGVYDVTLTCPDLVPSTQQLRFAVYASTPELLDTSADPDAMRALANGTGGHVLSIDQPHRLLDHLDTIRAAAGTLPHVESSWDQWWLMAVILTSVSVEWLLRRRWSYS